VGDRITYGQMAERSPRQKTRQPSEEKSKVGFGCFQGSLTIEDENS
jgi:hypothetical protein